MKGRKGGRRGRRRLENGRRGEGRREEKSTYVDNPSSAK
jgi:hypothetical protein